MSNHLAIRTLLCSGLAAGALVTALGVANAQPTQLPELVVVSPSLVPIEASKTGSSVTAMSGEEIRASGFSQLSDVMRTFPGMHVSQSGSRGSLTQFRVRGAEANLTFVEFEILGALARNPGRVFTRDQLLARIWGDAAYRDPRTIDVHIRHLREKLEQNAKSPEYIFTVRGVGYRFRDNR